MEVDVDNVRSCETCSKPLAPKRRRFCSRSCGRKRPPQTAICACCGLRVVRPKSRFCSSPCLLWGLSVKEPERGCLLFPHTSTGGYGSVHVTGRGSMRAHRYAWGLSRGVAAPPDREVMHRCDTPNCVNPEHLSLGSHLENIADKVKKGRQARGSRVGSSFLTEALVAQAREMLRAGVTRKAVAAAIGCSVWNVHDIASGRRWKHVA